MSAKSLAPYGSPRFASMAAKRQAGGEKAESGLLVPYGSARYGDLVAKGAMCKKTQAAAAPRRLVRLNDRED